DVLGATTGARDLAGPSVDRAAQPLALESGRSGPGTLHRVQLVADDRCPVEDRWRDVPRCGFARLRSATATAATSTVVVARVAVAIVGPGGVHHHLDSRHGCGSCREAHGSSLRA